MTTEQALARIAELEAKLQSKQSLSQGMKISEKGGLSVYGLGRFPVTLYASQWEALASRVPDIQAFINANRDKLKQKPMSTDDAPRGA